MDAIQTVGMGMSGGVDSSTAAFLLQRRGLKVIGITADLTAPPEGGESAVERASAVAEGLGIEHHTVDAQLDFKRWIVDPFVREYTGGRTPSPCILCNELIKFGIVRKTALSLGCDAVSTGHYARTGRDDQGRVRLLRGRDPLKDQSYFLHRLSQEALEQTVFPLGDWTKEDVRAFARTHHLPAISPTESQDLCFVENGRHAEFIESQHSEPIEEGDMVDRDGRVLGRHRGLHRYTVGQRKGLGIAVGEPVYVAALDRDHNRLVVAPEGAALKHELTAEDVNWIAGEPPAESFRTLAQIRHRHVPAACRVDVLEDLCVRVVFDDPQFAITPGQAVVFYQDDAVLGGGWIT